MSNFAYQETSQDTDGAAGRTSSPANRSTASTQSASSSTEVLQDRYQFHPVFLSTPSCKVTPHTLHLIEALPGMSLVVVCEVRSLYCASIYLHYYEQTEKYGFKIQKRPIELVIHFFSGTQR